MPFGFHEDYPTETCTLTMKLNPRVAVGCRFRTNAVSTEYVNSPYRQNDFATTSFPDSFGASSSVPFRTVVRLFRESYAHDLSVLYHGTSSTCFEYSGI